MSDTKNDPAEAAAKQRKVVDDLRAQHGRVGVIEFDDGRFIVVRKPKRAEYDSWFDGGGPGGKQSNKRQLLNDCRLYPSEADVDALLEDYPAALSGACMSPIYELAGMGKASGKVVG